MSLRLRDVPAAHGLAWLGDAWRLFRKRPVALTLMLCVFMGFVSLLLALPWFVGPPLVMMAPPLLSLGLMVAAQSALLDGPVHPRQFIEPLRGDRRRRNTLLLLCLLYGLSMMLIGGLAFITGGDAMKQFLAVLGGTEPGAGDPQRMAELLAQPDLRLAVTLFNVLVALLSVPFWHAPALVHWGQQGVAQALFSSTLALWRAKGAFTLYGLAWAGVSVFTTMLATLVLALLGAPLGVIGALTLTLAVMTVFYVSVLFTFNDSFGGSLAQG